VSCFSPEQTPHLDHHIQGRAFDSRPKLGESVGLSSAITGPSLTDPADHQNALQHGVDQLALSPRTGRTPTDPLGHQDGSQRGFWQLVLSLRSRRAFPIPLRVKPLMTGHSTWVTLRVKPPKSSRSLPVRFRWSRSAGTPSRWSSSERNGYMRKVTFVHLLAL